MNQCVHALYAAGQGKIGTDEKVFVKILTGNNLATLAAIDMAYKKTYGKKFMKIIKSEFSGDISRILRAIMLVARKGPVAYYAKMLFTSIDGVGTNDRQLIRTLATRRCIDMQLIIPFYKTKFKKNLKDHIKGDTSGDYRKLCTGCLDIPEC